MKLAGDLLILSLSAMLAIPFLIGVTKIVLEIIEENKRR